MGCTSYDVRRAATGITLYTEAMMLRVFSAYNNTEALIRYYTVHWIHCISLALTLVHRTVQELHFLLYES
jgi:hypothetical protein